MNPTIKELIEQHNHLHLDNAEDRKILIDVLTTTWQGAENGSYNNGFEDGYNEGQADCEE